MCILLRLDFSPRCWQSYRDETLAHLDHLKRLIQSSLLEAAHPTHKWVVQLVTVVQLLILKTYGTILLIHSILVSTVPKMLCMDNSEEKLYWETSSPVWNQPSDVLQPTDCCVCYRCWRQASRHRWAVRCGRGLWNMTTPPLQAPPVMILMIISRWRHAMRLHCLMPYRLHLTPTTRILQLVSTDDWSFLRLVEVFSMSLLENYKMS